MAAVVVAAAVCEACLEKNQDAASEREVTQMTEEPLGSVVKVSILEVLELEVEQHI